MAEKYWSGQGFEIRTIDRTGILQSNGALESGFEVSVMVNKNTGRGLVSGIGYCAKPPPGVEF